MMQSTYQAQVPRKNLGNGPICINASGETIPPNSALEVTGTERVDGRELLTVDKPSEDGLTQILLSPDADIPDGAVFTAISPFDAKVSIGTDLVTVEGSSVGTEADEWEMTSESEGFVVVARYDSVGGAVLIRPFNPSGFKQIFDASDTLDFLAIGISFADVPHTTPWQSLSNVPVLSTDHVYYTIPSAAIPPGPDFLRLNDSGGVVGSASSLVLYSGYIYVAHLDPSHPGAINQMRVKIIESSFRRRYRSLYQFGHDGTVVAESYLCDAASSSYINTIDISYRFVGATTYACPVTVGIP